MNQTTGELCLGCCKATNLCECARRRYLRETVRMLALDAEEAPPTIFAVLTAREFLRKDETVKRTMAQLLKALRRRWPVEWFCRWEEQSRGALHVNLLVKGVPVDEWEEFARVLVERWCARVDAESQGQYVEPILDGTAVTLYVAKKVLHAGKSNQEPHFRFKHRTSQTRGYLVRRASVMREEARLSLAVESKVWRGVPPELAALEVELERQHEWTLRHRKPSLEVGPRPGIPHPLMRVRVQHVDEGSRGGSAEGGEAAPGGAPATPACLLTSGP